MPSGARQRNLLPGGKGYRVKSAQKKAITFPAQIRQTSSSKDSDSSSDEDEDGCVANDTLAACLDDMGKMAKRHAEDTERMAKRMRRLV